jgi:sulfoquinovosyltransferase
MNHQWGLQFAGYVSAVAALVAARSLLVNSGAMTAALAGHTWLASVQAGVQASGPFGPAIFASAIALASMLPLVPTQPLFIAAGLLFGTCEGALISLLGALEAAFFAFVISRQKGVAKIATALASGAGFGAPIRRVFRDQVRSDT